MEGFNSAELVSVQRAINKLARSAAELEAGNLPAVVAVCEYGPSALLPYRCEIGEDPPYMQKVWKQKISVCAMGGRLREMSTRRT